jgi:hypothetical protein
MTVGKFADRQPIICDCGNHAFVAITKGLTTMVSPEDVHVLERRWIACPVSNVSRRCFTVVASLNGRTTNLGRVVLRLNTTELQPDHISHDALDNRRSNLRPATPAQNARNRRSGIKRDLPKGVHRNGSGFQAEITVNYRRWKLGTYRTPEEAHAAYAAAALEHHGEFAVLSE